MKNCNKRVSIFMFIIICSLITLSAGEKYAKSTYYYASVDRLRLRNAAGLKSTKLRYLGEGDYVECTGKKSDFTTKVTLRGKEYNEAWVEVKYQNETGWIYGGALSNKALSVKKMHWRALVIYDPLDPDDEDNWSEDWGYFAGAICTACAYQSVKILSAPYGSKSVDIFQPGPNNKKTKITTVDLTTAIPESHKNDRGYLLLEKGKKPGFVRHDMIKYALADIEKYYGFAIPQIQ